MRKVAVSYRAGLLLVGLIFLIFALTPGARSFSSSDSQAPVPVLVELFTSEGCSSCPPADALLQRMIDTQPLAGVRIIGLGEHVDYWDRLGWRDRFSSAAFTDRQQTYGARFNNASVYTPQMVVDGQVEFVGSDDAAARRAIERAAAEPHGRIAITARSVPPSAGAAHPAAAPATSTATTLEVSVVASELAAATRGNHADVVIAVTEDHLQSDVKRGENRGRLLKHAAVVRQLQVVGEAPPGGTATITTRVLLDPAWQQDQLNIVAFVQERRGRTVLAAAATPVHPR